MAVRRATRVPFGAVQRPADTEIEASVAPTPQQARVELILELLGRV